MKPHVSIFIPTKNAGSKFSVLLERIYNQKEKKREVIIVDSGSIDETEEIADSYPTKVYRIKPVEFGHGKTRNLALKYAKADYIVFLSQDARPKDDDWLSNLLRNFSEKKIAGVFSRQVPYREAKEIQRFFYKYYFPENKIVRPNKEYNSIQNRFFSNVSSCIKKDILQKYRFSDNILTTEDQEWAKRVIENGYKIIYEPESVVVHSHNHNLEQMFKRYFDSAFALNKITKNEYNEFIKGSQKYIVQEFIHIFQNKPSNLPYWIISNFVKVVGIFLGMNANKLSSSLKRKIF